MVAFREWLLQEERQTVDPSVLRQFERTFEAELEQLILRSSNNPPLRQALESMRDCPIRTARGCTTFTDYALGALLRNCENTVSIPDSFAYLMYLLLSRVGEKGQSRSCLFDIDPNREYDCTRGNPMEARLKVFIAHAIRSICGGKISRLLLHPHGPTVTIAPGRKNAGQVNADEIPDRPSDQDERELYADIEALLQQRSTADLPLLSIFRSMLKGEGLKAQRAKFGHTKTGLGRKIIYGVIEDYARQTGNVQLVNLMAKYRDYNPNKPNPTSRRSKFRQKPPKPHIQQLPAQVRDYLSILQVMQAAGGRATMALLGKKRRRWLERKPRDAASQARTRLHDVLQTMLIDGVLQRQGAAYVLGPNAQKYLDMAQPARTE